MSTSSSGYMQTQSQGTVNQQLRKLQQDNEQLIQALTTTADKLASLRQMLHPYADVVINDILTTVSHGLGLKQTDSLHLTRAQYQYAQRKSMEKALHLRTYIRSKHLLGNGFTIRHYDLFILSLPTSQQKVQKLSIFLVCFFYLLLFVTFIPRKNLVFS